MLWYQLPRSFWVSCMQSRVLPLFLSVGGETAELLPGQHVVLGANLPQGDPRFPLEPGYCSLIRCKAWPTSPFDDVILHKLLDSLSLKPTPQAAQP